ncbi:MAG: hypothetical protein ACJAUJ_001311 [Salibacteraceae bacterium]|jgi:hypothetical protein
MGRPLRLEFADALYHITARGNARNLIFLQDIRRQLAWPAVLPHLKIILHLNIYYSICK